MAFLIERVILMWGLSVLVVKPYGRPEGLSITANYCSK
jgi:hypothetical protein